MILERVVLSSDFGPKFLNFLPIVSHFWNAKFGILPDVGLVVRRDHWNLATTVAERFSSLASFHLLQSHSEVPIANQAKLARLFLAAQLTSSWTTVDDMDTAHFREDYLRERFLRGEPGKLLAIGHDVYQGTAHDGNFPMGNLSGDSQTFLDLFASFLEAGESFMNFLERLKTLPFHSAHANPWNSPSQFSDEYLVRSVRIHNGFDDRIILESRQLNILKQWLDRSWWPNLLRITWNRKVYSSANFPRPFLENRARILSALRIIDPTLPIPPLLLPYRTEEWDRLISKQL